MTKISYISAGIAAAVLAVSVSGGSAIAGDNPGSCMHLQGGFMWNICDHERNPPKGRPTRAEPQNPEVKLPVTRDRGI